MFSPIRPLSMLLLSLLACGGGKGGEEGEGGGADGGGEGGDNGPGEATCTNTGFLPEAVSWTMPPNSLKSEPQWSDLSGSAEGRCEADSTEDGIVRHNLLDLTGDGAADMVVTLDACASGEVGDAIWWVYPAEGNGFASSPLEWSMPPDSLKSEAQWENLGGTVSGRCAEDATQDGDLRFSLLDLSGDGAPDMVVTLDACASDEVGDSIWWVYENTGSGFASEPTAWSLPPDSLKSVAQWENLAGSASGRCADDASQDGDLRYSLLELTGDDKADLVVYKDACGSDEVGDSIWWVYENTGSGFSSSPTAWTMPPDSLKSTAQWEQLGGSVSGRCAADSTEEGVLRFSLLDLSGDGALDVVVSLDDCADDAVGESVWWVYAGEDGGFSSAPTAWTMPPDSLKSEPQWEEIAGTVSGRCAADSTEEGLVRFSLVDLSADGAADLVVTEDECANGDLGDTAWWVYLNEGSGFAQSPATWTMPAASLKSEPQWTALAGAVSGRCAEDSTKDGTVRYSLGELTGDYALDIVITQDDCVDDAVGESIWRVFPGDCR